MAPETLNALLDLSAGERAELAMALWESLDEAQRAAAFPLTAELGEELDRRLQQHVAEPGSSIPWPEVRRKMTGEG